MNVPGFVPNVYPQQDTQKVDLVVQFLSQLYDNGNLSCQAPLYVIKTSSFTQYHPTRSAMSPTI